jgi:hypothetical protein
MLLRLNAEPLNAAAGALLPPDWRGNSSLSVLALALWGAQNGIGIELPGAGVTDEQVLEQVAHLQLADPAKVMALLEGLGDDQLLAPDALDDLTREQAAFLILEAVRDLLVAHEP